MCGGPGRALPEVTRALVVVSQSRSVSRRPDQPERRPPGHRRRINRWLSRGHVDELHVMTLAFEGTGKSLVTRAPPTPAAARNEYVRTVDEQQAEEVAHLTTRAHPDGRADTTGDRQRAIRFTESGQIMSASGQISAIRHDVRNEQDKLDILAGRERPHLLKCRLSAVLARREDVDAARHGQGPSDDCHEGHDHIIETATQKRAEEGLKSP
jgi:hypothetical protein